MIPFFRHGWIPFLILFYIRQSPARARNCTCTTGEFSDCKQGVCIASSSMPKFACEMSVRLAPNRSVTDVKYYCLTGLSPPCHGKPQIEPSGVTIYYACCGDEDECNRCLMPGALPYEAKLQIEINRNCNFSSLPTQTASLLLQSTLPSSSNVQSDETQLDNVVARKYLHAAIGVGSATVVCLVAVPVIVTAVWCRRRLHVHRTEDDEVTNTITVSTRKLLPARYR